MILLLFGCSLTENFFSPPQKPSPAGPGILWNETETPLFPASWPPGPDTTWVSYTFAYGSDPTRLSDGNYVSAPLARTEWKPDGTSQRTVLREEAGQASIQGVSPLDEAALQVFGTAQEARETCLTFSALPDPDDPDVKTVLAYYQAWFKYNGAFLALVKADHAGFVDWVKANAAQ